MDKFDEKVIGYESTKEILRQILDILKRPEVYKRKGISIPRGLLMESDPGLGKSLLASILMEESERKPFVFRKTSQENSFLDELRAVFAMAKEEAPSILLLEDLNLYVESNSPYAPEWACLQACIDDAKDTDLFVIATTNDTRYMPPSLLRPGRFDYVIYLQPPIGENAENIVSYYLRDKDLAENVLISDIVKAMPKVSCATLETVMNLAALNSVYQSHEHIQKEDIIEALLQVVYKLQKTDKETDSSELQKIAVHEAAHAVVGEVLHPGSIGIVTVRGSQGVIGGMANGCATYAQNEEEFLDEVTKTLAGRAGVSLIYGVMDIQASADIEQADKLMDIWLCHFAGGGFAGTESGDNRMSEQRLSYNEAIKSAKLEELYRRAYKISGNKIFPRKPCQHPDLLAALQRTGSFISNALTQQVIGELECFFVLHNAVAVRHHTQNSIIGAADICAIAGDHSTRAGIDVAAFHLPIQTSQLQGFTACRGIHHDAAKTVPRGFTDREHGFNICRHNYYLLKF